MPGGPEQFSIVMKVNKEIFNKLFEYSKENKITVSQSVKRILAMYFSENLK